MHQQKQYIEKKQNKQIFPSEVSVYQMISERQCWLRRGNNNAAHQNISLNSKKSTEETIFSTGERPAAPRRRCSCHRPHLRLGFHHGIQLSESDPISTSNLPNSNIWPPHIPKVIVTVFLLSRNFYSSIANRYNSKI